MSSESFEVLNLLKDGLKISEAQKFMKDKYNEDFDVLNFVSELQTLGFIKSIDEVPLVGNDRRKQSLSFIKKSMFLGFSLNHYFFYIL